MYKLKGLIWKNILIKKHNKLDTIAEYTFPVILSIVCGFLKTDAFNTYFKSLFAINCCRYSL